MWGVDLLILEEREMYPILKRHFKRKGYLVIVNQFSLLSPKITSDIPDVVVANWSNKNLLDVITVECKLEEEPKISGLRGIRQAIEYQICFPRVYIATQKGDIGYVKKIFEHNSIGHLEIDLSSNEVSERIIPKRGILYDESLFKLNIKDRLILALVFRDLFGADFRMGEMNTHGWAAKDFSNHVQLNCYYDPPSGIVYSGFNLERKSGFRNVYKKIGAVEFSESLKNLPDDYALEAWIDLWPSGNSKDMFPEKQANKVTMADLNKIADQIETILLRKKPTERPHLQIRHEIWNNRQYLSREVYTKKIKNTFGQLRMIFNYLRS